MFDALAHLECAGERALRERGLMVGEVGLVPRLRGFRVQALASWLNTWNGVGAIVTGMTRQSLDPELRQYLHGGWARFYLAGASHPVALGTGWAVTPWAAVQTAAWETLATGKPEARLRRSSRHRPQSNGPILGAGAASYSIT